VNSSDRIQIGASRTWGDDGFFVAAHEYGHAFHNTALGGIGAGSGQCPGSGHFLNSAYNLQCAYTEGFGTFYGSLVMQDSLVGANYEGLVESPNTAPTLWTYLSAGSWCDASTSYLSCTAGQTTDGGRAEIPVAAFLYDLADNSATANGTPGVDDDAVAYGPAWVADVVTSCQVYQASAWIRSNGPDHLIYCFEQRLGNYAQQGYFPTRSPVPTNASWSGSLPGGWNADAVKAVWQNVMYPNGAPPPPPLSVTLNGPSPVRPGAECTWLAGVTGGVQPYSYVWKKNGAVMAGQTTGMVVTSFSSNGTLQVTVSDNVGTVVSKQKTVNVSGTAPICPF
jgi:hypothetical protein